MHMPNLVVGIRAEDNTPFVFLARIALTISAMDGRTDGTGNLSRHSSHPQFQRLGLLLFAEVLNRAQTKV